MKNIAIASLMTVIAVNAHSAPEKFASAAFGTTITSIESETATTSDTEDTDASSTYSLAFGVEDGPVRLYLDLSHENNKVANTNTLGLNADYQFPLMSKLNVFVGATIGHATTIWDTDNETVMAFGLDGESDGSFVYGGKLGANFSVIPSAAIELGVRYLASNLVNEVDDNSLKANDSTNTYLGVTYKF